MKLIFFRNRSKTGCTVNGLTKLHLNLKSPQKAIIIFFLAFLISFSAIGQKTNFLSSYIWLRADKYNKNLPYWGDISGNKRDAIPDTGYVPDADSLINFNKAIFFDGVDDKFRIPFPVSKSPQITVATVYRSEDDPNEKGIWNVRINNDQDINMTDRCITGPQSIVRYSGGVIPFPVVSAVAQLWSSSTASAAPAITLGQANIASSGPLTFKGVIAEYIVFDRLLAGIERQMLQSYLGIRYGATMQYMDYITSRGAVIWNYNANKEYSASVAGIGRDDNFYLNQKQSGVTDGSDFLFIAAGKAAASNDRNNYALKDGEFLVWGNNGKQLKPELNGDSATRFPLIERKWIMEATGSNANTIPTEIVLNTSYPIRPMKQCYLVIDRSAKGDFSSASTEYIAADSVEKGKAFFKNIKWDTDKSGTDLFTFSFGDIVAADGAFAAARFDDSRLPNISYNYSLYPNPSKGDYTIKLTFNGQSDVSIKVLDGRGSLISEHNGKGSLEYIFKGHVQMPGLYVVEIRSKYGRELFKLIVTR